MRADEASPPTGVAAMPTWLRSSSVAWLAALLAALVIALTAGFVAYEERSLEETELQSAELYARVLLDHAQRTFDTIDIALGSLGDTLVSIDVNAAPSAVSRELVQAQAGLPFLRSLSVMTAASRVLASSTPANVGRTIDRRRVPLPRDDQIDVLGSSVEGRDLGDAAVSSAPAAASPRSFVPLVRRFGNATSEPLFIVAVLNPEFFANEHELTLADASRSAALFGLDQVMLSGTSGIVKLPGSRAAGHRFFSEFLPAHESGRFIGPGIDGARVITAFRTLRKRPLVVVVERRFDDVMAHFKHTVYGAAGAALAALLVIAAMAVMAWRSLRGHEAVRQAHESQRQFTAQLLEISPTPIFVKDARGRFTTVNRAWLELMGLTLPEVLGRHSDELFGANAPKHNDQDAKLLQSTEQLSYENRLHVTGRLPRDTVVTKVRFTRADGTPAGIVGSIIDVTEFREAERQIREARDAAALASGAKSEFIANISHELRTPLQAIIGFSEIGGEMAGELPDFLDLFNDIQAGGRRMLTLVNGLLDVSQMDSAVGSLALERCDVGPLVREAVRQLQPKAVLRDQTVRVLGLETPRIADVDPARFQQALRNVLANAVRFAPINSVIELSCLDDDSGGVVLTVRDHGPGVPDDELEAIFESFVQSSRTRDGSGGTGLGLTITRKIMSAHGGSVIAANATGDGALFRIALPAPGALLATHHDPSWQDSSGLLYA